MASGKRMRAPALHLLNSIGTRACICCPTTHSSRMDLFPSRLAMLDRMRTGKLRVFKEHLDWWEEFRLYHRKDGKVVKEGDDLLCATRYALMSLRFASTQAHADKWRRPIEYPKLGIV